MKKSQRQAFALAYRLTGNTAEAEDLVQEAYVRAYRFFHRYDPTMPFTSWLFRIVTNAHIDMVRRRGRFRTTSIDQGGDDGKRTLEIEDCSAMPETILTEQSVNEHLQEGLESMNHDFRTAIILADVEGMAYEEIADVMKTSIGTVRSRIHRGRKHLRTHLLKQAPGLYERYCDDVF